MAAKPTTTHMASYRSAISEGDARLVSPTFPRNSPPMIAELVPWLADQIGTVVEIGAGTGQHAAAFALAFRHLDWLATDPDPIHIASTAAWAEHLGVSAPSPLLLDASSDWATHPAIVSAAPVIAVLSMNVIHIAPLSVLEGIVNGAGEVLGRGGLLLFYGPFKENGEHTGEGNAAFDRGLRAENPEWGVRDIAEIESLAGHLSLVRAGLIQMPANNRLLVLRKA